ncbi:hypothetical protein FHR51_002581 [Xanthomonas arboricola]|uniref:hypothetical protein n=1 Tax=Xanthomonas cannabis TaxID=1885674 RepID=UPI00161D46DE|nr:hypothetical protein [Xanthomonas cannabis]MBB3806429.1 hypothetical protein [Xanthomonas cannabis]
MIDISGLDVRHCVTGISLPSDCQIKIVGSRVVDCETGVMIRDSSEFLEKIGLKSDTPPEELLEVLRGMASGHPPASSVKKKIAGWLTSAADLTTVLGGLAQLAQRIELPAIARVLGL